MQKRRYNTRKKRLAKLNQMMFCERCGEAFFPSRKYPYVCMWCRSVDARRQNGEVKS